MLHFETHTLWSGAKVSAFCFLGRIALFSNWVREVQGNDLHLLGTIEDFVREKTLHQDAEPAKRNPGHYRNSADDSGQQPVGAAKAEPAQTLRSLRRGEELAGPARGGCQAQGAKYRG